MISLRKSVFACVLTTLLAVSFGTLAETMQEMRDSAGLKVEQSESLGGGEQTAELVTTPVMISLMMR